MIEAVFFDLDDTLLDDGAATRSGIDTLLGRCPSVGREAAHRAWDAAFARHFPRYLSGELTFDAARVERVRDWADEVGVQVEPGDELSWFDDFLVGYEAGWTAFEDASSVAGMMQGFRLGIITNGDSAQRRAKLDALELGVSFEVVVASGDVDMAKPDPRVFHLAADRLDVDRASCVHVGDSWDRDVLGAHAAGFTAVWLNRHGAAAPERRDVLEITSL